MPRVDTRYPTVRERHQRRTSEALASEYRSQRDDILARLDAGAGVLLPEQFDRRLRDVIFDRHRDLAANIGLLVARAFDNGEYDPDIMDEWLAENAEIKAAEINGQTRSKIDPADPDRTSEVLDNLEDGGVRRHAATLTATAANFAAQDAGEKSGAGLKRWETNSGNSRAEHARMNGETVPIGERFSNRLRWPGDSSAGSAEDNANCRCSMTIL